MKLTRAVSSVSLLIMSPKLPGRFRVHEVRDGRRYAHCLSCIVTVVSSIKTASDGAQIDFFLFPRNGSSY